jgi:hypothetical protein
MPRAHPSINTPNNSKKNINESIVMVAMILPSPAFHAGDRGSNPLGDANKIEGLATFGWPLDLVVSTCCIRFA